MKTHELTTAEMCAVAAYATAHGRTWKAELGSDWMRAAYRCVDDRHHAALQTLRNTRGPSWLQRFRLHKATIVE